MEPLMGQVPGRSISGSPMPEDGDHLISVNERPQFYFSMGQCSNSSLCASGEHWRELPKPTTWENSRHLGSKADQRMGHDAIGAIPDPDNLVKTTYPVDYENYPKSIRLWERGPQTDRSASNFQYQKLQGSDEIRLLILHPGEGPDPLDFDLRHIEIGSNEEEEYRAMSYVWGTTMVDITYRDGNVLSLPDNLYRALLRLRPSRTCKTSLVLWADSICINQNDKGERGHQVRLMRKIYQQSTQVIVWLGDKDLGVARQVFDLSRYVFEKRAEKMPRPESADWKNVLDLFNVEWFRRLWCLQEIVLAANAEVHWGPLVAPWEHLGFTASWICNAGHEVLHFWQRNIRHCHIFEDDKHHLPGVHRASLMYSLYLSYRSSDPQSSPFNVLLDMTRQFETGDPRDKAFALTGIPTTEADPDAGKLFVDPDYTKTTTEIYTDLAKRFVECSGSLRLLSAVQHRSHGYFGQLYTYIGHDLADLPSWVPNWTISECRTLVPSMPNESHPPRSASLNLGPSKTTITIQGDKKLITSGLLFDEAEKVESLLPRDSSGSLLYILGRAYSTLLKTLGYHASRQSLGEAFVWTITGGIDCYGNPLSIHNPHHRRTHIGDYRAFRHHLLSNTGADGGQYLSSQFPDMEDALPQIAEDNDPEKNELPDFGPFLEAVWHATSNRQLFITKKGYIGLCPSNTVSGNLVAILHGADMPFILEPVREKDAEGGSEGRAFKVVGESYVHGIMDGEISGDEASDIRTIKLV